MDVETPKPFNGWDYETAGEAAKAFYQHLAHVCKILDLKHEVEAWIKDPEQSREHGYGVSDWWVALEAGPYSWGVNASMRARRMGPIEPPGIDNLYVAEIDGPWGFCETYWGFDLIFVEDPL